MVASRRNAESQWRANRMTRDEEAQLLELLRDAYDIIEALDNRDYRDWLDDARELLDKVGRQ
jgi:hypothetical protein